MSAKSPVTAAALHDGKTIALLLTALRALGCPTACRQCADDAIQDDQAWVAGMTSLLNLDCGVFTEAHGQPLAREVVHFGRSCAPMAEKTALGVAAGSDAGFQFLVLRSCKRQDGLSRY